MSRLQKYFEHPTVSFEKMDDNEIDQILFGLEDLTHDVYVSTEAGIGDLFKEAKETIGDRLKAIFKGAGSVQEGFVDRLNLVKKSIQELDNKHEKDIKLSSISSYLYDNNRKRFQTDIYKALRDDVEFIDAGMALIEDIIKGMRFNDRLLINAANLKGDKKEVVEAFKEYWTGGANLKIVNSGLVYNKATLPSVSLNSAYYAMSNGFDASLKGEDFIKQQHYIRLKTERGDVSNSAKRSIEDPVTFSKSDMIKFIDTVILFSNKTTELVELIKKLDDDFNPRKGREVKKIVEVEQMLLEMVGLSGYLAGIRVLIPANVSLISTAQKLPKQLLSRNLRIIRAMIRFSEQFF